MAHLIVGDGHYVGAAKEAEQWQTLLDTARTRGVREVSVLGDFFELWLGLEGLEQPWQESFLEPLRRLKQAGVRLRYVVGNKDYFIETWNRRHRLFDEVGEQLRAGAPAHPLYLAHGDLVNRADRQYRLWRRLSRSWGFTRAVRALPRRWLAAVSHRVAKGMEATNRYHKSYFPEDQLRARARELPGGPGTLIFGHFHVYRTLQEGDKTVVTLPFLGGENAGLWVEEGRLERVATSSD